MHNKPSATFKSTTFYSSGIYPTALAAAHSPEAHSILVPVFTALNMPNPNLTYHPYI